MNTSDDFDAEPRMSFGDHLDELRRRVLFAVIGIFVFFVLGLCFQEDLFAIIRQPHDRAMEQINAGIGLDDPRRYDGPYGLIRWAQDRMRLERYRALPPLVPPTDPAERAAFDTLVAQQERFAKSPSIGSSLVATRYPEAFLTGLKAAFVLALLLGAPWTLFQGWSFVAAGLYPHERRYVRLFLPTSVGLFAAGTLFGYFILIPYGLAFLGGMASVPTMITLGEYFSLFLTLTFALGVVFQLPLLMMSLTLLGIVPARTYAEKRRFFILGAFVFGALLTPPDPWTQAMMAVPILVLFEFGLVACKMIERRGKPRSAEQADGSAEDADGRGAGTGDGPADGTADGTDDGAGRADSSRDSGGG